MEEVNVPDHKIPAAKASDRRRVQVCVRVRPETAEYIDKLGFANRGRALDGIIGAIQRPEVMGMVAAGQGLKILAIG